MTLLPLACLFAAAAAAPLLYDQRQDGELNVSADVQNVIFVVAIPQKMSLPQDFLEDFLKSKPHRRDSDAQERADGAMGAFVEPNTPYRVEIGAGDRSAGSDGRAAEVVIAGRRRPGPEPENESDADELKLIGAMEQCGPDRERDPVTLTCRWRSAAVPVAAPAAVPVAAPAAVPVAAPAAVPVAAPAAVPVAAPAAVPVAAPAAVPVAAPAAVPVTAPVTAPAAVPVTAPVAAPAVAPASEQVQEKASEPTPEVVSS